MASPSCTAAPTPNHGASHAAVAKAVDAKQAAHTAVQQNPSKHGSAKL